MGFKIDGNAEKILCILNENGYEAYIVGGCVRDMILGRVPGDWDITTSAKPEETKKCFSHTYDTGIKHGTITALMGKDSYEITTYRIEGEYTDCRHPDEVVFTRDIHEDLLRRDFTMNAIAYHPKEGFIDPFGGVGDIEKKLIKGVGCPEERFREDALRMLRAVRFAAQLGFAVEDETWKALKDNAHLITKISAERIREELQKLIMSDRPEKINFLAESGLTEHIYAPLAEILKEKGSVTAEELSRAEKLPALRWALFLKELGAKEAESLMKKLKFDTKTMKAASAVIAEGKNGVKTDRYGIKKTAERLGDEIYVLFLKYSIAGGGADEGKAKEALKIYEDIKRLDECINMKQLKINGSSLKEMGVKDGKLIGEILKAALDEAQKDNENNKKEVLEKFVRERFLL